MTNLLRLRLFGKDYLAKEQVLKQRLEAANGNYALHDLQLTRLLFSLTEFAIEHGGEVGGLLAEESFRELVFVGPVLALDSDGDLRAGVELEDPGIEFRHESGSLSWKLTSLRSCQGQHRGEPLLVSRWPS